MMTGQIGESSDAVTRTIRPKESGNARYDGSFAAPGVRAKPGPATKAVGVKRGARGGNAPSAESGRWSRRAVLTAGAAAAWILAGSWARQRPSLAPSLPALEPLPTPVPAPAPSAPDLSQETEVAVEAPAPAPEPWKPSFVRRHTWAAEAPATNHLPLGKVERLTIHHTGADTRALGLTDVQAVQSIEDYHRLERGWACIGYHFLIGHDGTVYEGRPIGLQGAHVRDANEYNLGIACIGNFDTVLPAEAQLASLMYLVERIRAKARLPITALHGHRDLSPSTCPGDRLYAWMQETWYGEAQG